MDTIIKTAERYYGHAKGATAAMNSAQRALKVQGDLESAATALSGLSGALQGTTSNLNQMLAAMNSDEVSDTCDDSIESLAEDIVWFIGNRGTATLNDIASELLDDVSHAKILCAIRTATAAERLVGGYVTHDFAIYALPERGLTPDEVPGYTRLVERNTRIVARFNAGESKASLARAFGLSAQGITRVIDTPIPKIRMIPEVSKGELDD